MTDTNDIVAHIDSTYREIYRYKDFIPLHEPWFSGREVEYVTDCIKTGWVSSVGRYVDRFAEELAHYCKVKYAVPVMNGTAALHIALLVNGIGPEDEVICPDVSFVATAAAIVYTGANPVFLDVDEDTLGLSPVKVREWLEGATVIRNGKRYNKVTGKRVSACIAMHNIGFPLRIQELKEICEEYSVHLIEDAAEALGSHVGGKMCGTFGICGIFSFNGNKIITTGGGGMLVTNDEGLYRKAAHLSTTAKVPHPYMYDHDEIGYNYRMPNINAALGLAQLERFPEILHHKRKQFEYISKALGRADITIRKPPCGCSNNWFIVAEFADVCIDDVITGLNKRGVMARPAWSRISEMKPYAGYYAGTNEGAQHLSKTIVCLPNGVAA